MDYDAAFLLDGEGSFGEMKGKQECQEPPLQRRELAGGLTSSCKLEPDQTQA